MTFLLNKLESIGSGTMNTKWTPFASINVHMMKLVNLTTYRVESIWKVKIGGKVEIITYNDNGHIMSCGE